MTTIFGLSFLAALRTESQKQNEIKKKRGIRGLYFIKKMKMHRTKKVAIKIYFQTISLIQSYIPDELLTP